MIKLFKLSKMVLDLFDGAAAATGDGASAESQGDSNTISYGNTRRAKSGEYSNVKFGKQPEAEAEPQDAAVEKTDVETTSNTLEDRRKAFYDLVNGEYKDIYSEETQRIINRRFKETKELQSKIDKSQPVIDMLMQRYGIDDGDMTKLSDAIDSDDAYWTDAADEAGMSVTQYKQFLKLQRDNAALRAAQQQAQESEFAQLQAQKWYADAEALKSKFPKFDLATELDNPQFLSLLKSGTPVEHAYKVIHFDELMGDAMSTTAASVEKTLVDNIRAKGSRPQENGTAAQSAFTVKDDVSKLTKADRAEIAKRVARGELISF